MKEANKLIEEILYSVDYQIPLSPKENSVLTKLQDLYDLGRQNGIDQCIESCNNSIQFMGPYFANNLKSLKR